MGSGPGLLKPCLCGTPSDAGPGSQEMSLGPVGAGRHLPGPYLCCLSCPSPPGLTSPR